MRSELILDFVDAWGRVSYDDLAKFLGVSTMTVRRDCGDLAQEGKVLKTVGGVQRVNAELGFYEKTTDERMAMNALEKRAIAKEALELITEPCAIFVDGSSTCLALAKLIDRERDDLTVVTHSPEICLALRSGKNSVICAGGEFEPRSLCLVGADTENFVRSMFIDMAFISATGFIADEGTFESSPPMFRVKQAAARQASQVVLLADHTKFGRRALVRALDLSQIHHVVTKDQVPKTDISLLEIAKINVRICVSVLPAH
jgi:DeoR/GlpR family transcriptional regulator of sugar metabolism